MKTWDFTSGAAKLEMAMKSMQIADANAEEYWDDAAHQKFREDHLEPLETRVRTMLDAIKRLAETFAAAERQCGTNY
jgi:hypothetical protein